MNTTPQNRQTNQKRAPRFGGNSVTESESVLALLYHKYRDAGLQLSDAWDAALADYAHGFDGAA